MCIKTDLSYVFAIACYIFAVAGGGAHKCDSTVIYYIHTLHETSQDTLLVSDSEQSVLKTIVYVCSLLFGGSACQHYDTCKSFITCTLAYFLYSFLQQLPTQSVRREQKADASLAA